MTRGLSILSVLISIASGVVIVIGVMLLFPWIGMGIMDSFRGGEIVKQGEASRTDTDVTNRLKEMEKNAEEHEKITETNNDPETLPEPVTSAQPTNTAAVDTSIADILDQNALDEIQRREERRRAAMESPLGESIHTVESIRAASQSENNGVAEILQPRLADLNVTAGSDPLIIAPQTGRGQLLAAGSVIPASLINDIRSDLPGLIRGHVTNDVYDTLTGAHVVIPRGTMLLGSYGDDAAQGQTRLFIYWTRMLFPDGTSVDLQKAGGVDAAGASGLKGRRRSGFITALLGGALLNLVQNAGRQNTTSSDLATAARAATQASVGTVADRYLESALSQGPIFAVKAGAILNVQIEQDYYFAGYQLK